ncbi:hypothetical protein [Paracoccus denitrificans]|uniref:hypothetical protein n=1 Tax=Paracoccus denitrificans TaxID=266 RepID=UPI001319EC27|nr:hypothetical protein [Paracoccus denitrificans]
MEIWRGSEPERSALLVSTALPVQFLAEIVEALHDENPAIDLRVFNGGYTTIFRLLAGGDMTSGSPSMRPHDIRYMPRENTTPVRTSYSGGSVSALPSRACSQAPLWY